MNKFTKTEKYPFIIQSRWSNVMFQWQQKHQRQIIKTTILKRHIAKCHRVGPVKELLLVLPR